MSEEVKTCPFCSEEIPANTYKCPYCKEVLINEKINPNQNTEILYKYNDLIHIIDKIIKFLKSNTLKITIQSMLILAIVTCVIWVFVGDYPAAMINQDKLWYGEYLTAGILHTLLAILCAIILLILK